MKRSPLLSGFIIISCLVVGVVTSLFIGAVRLPFAQLIAELNAYIQGEAPTPAVMIVLFLRLPRVVAALLVGSSLALAGSAYQGFFRNSLADPFVIGASSGAALGAAASIVFNLTLVLPWFTPAVAAFIGAILATILAFLVARAAGDPPPPVALLLAGTALSSLFSALVSLILVLKDKDLHRVYYWLLGGLGTSNWAELAAAAPVMLVGALLIAASARSLDLYALGEATARGLGADPRRVKLLVVAGAGLCTAGAVALTGIIGFVGLVAPHIARLAVGPRHRRLLPTAAAIGAVLMLGADTAARTLAAPLELPVGILTATLGAPFFLGLLVNKRQRLGGQL